MSLTLAADENRVYQFRSLKEQEILFGNPYLEELHRLAADLMPLRSMGELKSLKGNKNGARDGDSAAKRGKPCTRCETVVKPGTNFCPNCGLPQVKEGEKLCPSCETKNPSRANFCMKCNHKFKTFKKE